MKNVRFIITFISIGFGLITVISILFILRIQNVKSAGTTRYVSKDGCGIYSPCYSTIQAAIDASSNGDVIKLKNGIYSTVNNYSSLKQVVYLNKSISLLGGYDDNFSEPPDPDTNVSNINPQGNGRGVYITDNSKPIIDGVHISEGDASGLGGNFLGQDCGGGIYIYDAESLIKNSQIYSNTAWNGGGIYVRTGTTTLIQDNIFSNNVLLRGGGVNVANRGLTVISKSKVHDNVAGYKGGGLYASLATDLSHKTVTHISINDSVFTYNNSERGGGIYSGTAITITNSSIMSNTATDGGGLYLLPWSDAGATAMVDNNSIFYNTATGNGGGGFIIGYGTNVTTIKNNNIQFNNSGLECLNCVNWGGGGLYLDVNAVLDKNKIINNYSQAFGGGLLLENADVELRNNIVAKNQSYSSGCGIVMIDSVANYFHTTIADNYGGSGSGLCLIEGLMSPYKSEATLSNTIIVSQTYGIIVGELSTATLNSTLWGIGDSKNEYDWAGTGTISTTNDFWGNPDFVDPDAGDYHIGAGSAAIDKGIDAGVKTDIDFQPRPYLTPDLGADEYWPPGALKFIYLPLVMR